MINTPTDNYPFKKLSDIPQKPIGKVKFKEPVFRIGVFQNRYIETTVVVYPISYKDPKTNTILAGVRFGQMPVVRFINKNLIYNFESLI